MRLRFFLIFLCTFCLSAFAQSELPTLRPVTSSYFAEYGSSHIADTYLTPLHYRGMHSAIRYQREQAMRFSPEQWTMQLRLGMAFDHTENPAKNATMVNGAIEAGWMMMHRWRLPLNLTVGIGPGTSINAGVLYLSRNGNNPASAKASWTVDASGYLAWSGKIWKLPLTLRYQPTMALAGAFFSPDYGELYYQIYIGQHEGLLHGAFPWNHFSLDNLVTADFHLGNTSVRVGYHNNIFSSKVNDIVTQNISHSIVVGITTEWISIKPNSKEIKARMISSY